jgi:hypothetical protein
MLRGEKKTKTKTPKGQEYLHDIFYIKLKITQNSITYWLGTRSQYSVSRRKHSSGREEEEAVEEGKYTEEFTLEGLTYETG